MRWKEIRASRSRWWWTWCGIARWDGVVRVTVGRNTHSIVNLHYRTDSYWSGGLHQDSTLDFSNDFFIFNVGVSKLYSSQNEVISDQACRMWIPFFLVVFQSMSEPEQPEPEVAEAGPGNAGNACFVRLMPDLLQFPSTDIHGQNVTVNIHVTRMSQCILENCRRVRTEYMRSRCQIASSRDNMVKGHAVHQVQQPCHRVIWQWQSYTYCMDGVSSVKVIIIYFVETLVSISKQVFGNTWEVLLPGCESLPGHTVPG